MERGLEAMRALYRLADPDRPPPHALHVERKPSVVGAVTAALAAEPHGKHVVCGPRGVGTSSELREIARALAPALTVVDVDLDGSGLAAGELTAIDLGYVVGVRALSLVPAGERAARHEELASACAGGNSGRLGSADEAVAGIAGFGDAMTAVEGAALALDALAGVADVRRRLIVPGPPAGGPVTTASPQGRRVEAAIESVLDAAARARGGRPMVVLVDGLDVDVDVGDADARAVRELLSHRLVRDLPVAMVAAAALPLVHGDGAPTGWCAHAVTGFAGDERAALALALLKRINAAGVDADDAVAITERLALDCDGHPRRAFALLRAAALHALTAGRARLAPEDVDAASR